LNVSYDTSPNKAILESHQLRVLVRIHNLDIHEFNIQVLIDTVQGPRKDNIILEFDGNLFPDKGFEKA